MQHLHDRETDWNALMRAVLLMAFTALVVRLFVSGDITMYIHPKFSWFTATAGFGMVLMAAGQFAKALRGAPAGVPLRGGLYLAFAAVLATGFLLRPHTFGADLATKQGLNITSLATISPTPQPPAPAQTAEPAPPVPAATGSSVQPAPPAPTPASPPITLAAPRAGAVAESPVALAITSDNFVTSMVAIYGSHPQWAGKRISVEGFVFSPTDLPPDEFGFARLVVTCHVAHAAPQGFVAYYPGGRRPADDTWHHIEGVLEPTMYQGESTLRLRVEKITPIPKPPDPYVYG